MEAFFLLGARLCLTPQRPKAREEKKREGWGFLTFSKLQIQYG